MGDLGEARLADMSKCLISMMMPLPQWAGPIGGAATPKSGAYFLTPRFPLKNGLYFNEPRIRFCRRRTQSTKPLSTWKGLRVSVNQDGLMAKIGENMHGKFRCLPSIGVDSLNRKLEDTILDSQGN